MEIEIPPIWFETGEPQIRPAPYAEKSSSSVERWIPKSTQDQIRRRRRISVMLQKHPDWGKGRLSCSCSHGGGEMWSPADEAAFRDEGYTDVAKGIEKLYVAAAERLPLDEIPGLVGCIDAGGLCLGLADPVTNIILNAIALLPPPPPKTQPEPKKPSICGGYPIATKSYDGLCVFMATYFSCLSKTQARRYLYLACQDLPLAMDLVHYDRSPSYSEEWRRRLLPDGGQIKLALHAAALKAKHRDPDVLAALMTA